MLVGALVGVLVSGCLRANVAMTVSADDHVSGEILVAARSLDGQAPVPVQPPPDLAGVVQAEPYAVDGRAGMRLSFNGLTFDQIERLGMALGPPGHRDRLRLTRSGSLVTIEGSIDLTALANTDTAVSIQVNAPGQVLSSNGRTNSGTVSWQPAPGQVTPMSVTYQFSGTGREDWVGWAVLVDGGGLATALFVAMLALVSHRRTRAAEAA
jgi:hypothetical protein